MHWKNSRLAAIAGLITGLLAGSSHAGVVFNLNGTGLAGGSRWDAAPRNVAGEERSLSGGLRYSLQGGSYQAYRDLFTFSGGPPPVADFTAAVNAAFNAWSSVDPVSHLGTTLTFVPDLSTPVVGVTGGAGGVDRLGAEIDLFGATDASLWNPGDNRTQGETYFADVPGNPTLTSGTASYPGRSISGADITMNSNSQAVYTLDLFRRILTHEIGHALGLGDVEGSINPGIFIDDNYDGSTSAKALETLTNSWAGLVDVFNPSASPLFRYTIPVADPGLTTPGVDILMESFGVGISAGSPVTNVIPLSNDDYGTRQFLYPVPEPGAAWLIGAAAVACGSRRRRSA